MSITVGMSSAGAKYRVLRLTMSEGDAALAKSYWGDPAHVSYTAEALGDGRWLLTFSPDPDGNVGHVQRLPKGEREYLSWSWAARDPNALLGVPPIRKKAHRGELLQWHDDGRLEIIVRGKKERARRAPAPAAQPIGRVLEVSNTPLIRLTALKNGVNHALAELAQAGMRIRVSQAEPGQPIEMNIDL